MTYQGLLTLISQMRRVRFTMQHKAQAARFGYSKQEACNTVMHATRTALSGYCLKSV